MSDGLSFNGLYNLLDVRNNSIVCLILLLTFDYEFVKEDKKKYYYLCMETLYHLFTCGLFSDYICTSD
jgi:hypothetical protein